MSSIKFALGCAALLALTSGGLALRTGGKAAPAGPALVCPGTISVTEGVAPIEGWTAGGERVPHRFERISVLNKDSDHEYDLAPDGQKTTAGKVTQTWNLQGYRTLPLFLTCRYQGTAATLWRELPAPLTACTFTFQLDKSGGISGEPSMSCR